MPDLEVENAYVESDVSDDEEQHSKLLSSLSQLDSTQRVKPASRKEASHEVSEYNLSKGGSVSQNLVHVKELAQVLGKKPAHAVISKKFQNVIKKSKTLPKPLEKPVEERLKRSVGFESVRHQLRRWEAVVTRNALNDNLQFPLNDNSMKMEKSSEFLKQFKTATPLELEIAKALKQEEKPEKEEEEDAEFPLTLEEMMEKRREMAQIRAKLSYREAKAQRQSKIKSKKYHRILKRDKLRQQIKEFELLQKTDPEAALKKLMELDKSRAEERASLRHRNTGKWAKNMTVRAKYDIESRKVLADQLKMSREITQKVGMADSSDEDETPGPETLASVLFDERTGADKNNPWAVEVSEDVKKFVSGYKKYWTEKNKEAEERKEVEVKEVSEVVEASRVNGTQNGVESLATEPGESKTAEKVEKRRESPPPAPPRLNKREKKKPKAVASVSIHPASGVWIVTPIVEENHTEKKGKRKAENLDELFEDLNEEIMKKAVDKVKRLESKLKPKKKPKEKKKRKEQEFDLTLKNPNAVTRPDMDVELLEGGDGEEVAPTAVPPPINKAPPEIDPNKFIHVKTKKLNTRVPNSAAEGEEAVDDEEVQQMTIEEAFGDDDVVAEFKETKEEEEKKRQVEIDLSLPGWGEWGGKDVTPKKKLNMILKLPPRKDKRKDDIIINEKENPNLKKHLVKQVPHPFKSVDAFEANIRAPVGRDWVPESAHRKLIQKPVETKLGTIIEPMDEEEIVRLNKKRKSPYQGKKKNKEK